MTYPISWTCPIDVTGHAVSRAEERLGEKMTAAEIAAEIRVALLYDRICERRPGWTRFPRDRGPRPGPARHHRERFVWDEDASRCWAISLVNGRVVVQTVFASLDVAAAVAQRNLLRL